MSKIIGIDLGTSNSAASFLEGGRPRIISSAEGASQVLKAHRSMESHSPAMLLSPRKGRD